MIVNSETYLKKQKSFQIKLDTNLKNGQKGPKKAVCESNRQKNIIEPNGHKLQQSFKQRTKI